MVWAELHAELLLPRSLRLKRWPEWSVPWSGRDSPGVERGSRSQSTGSSRQSRGQDWRSYIGLTDEVFLPGPSVLRLRPRRIDLTSKSTCATLL